MPIVGSPKSVFGSKRVDPNSKTPYSDATRCRKKPGAAGKASHVRRPMNAFMVFAQLERNRILELSPNQHNAEISKNLGRKWKLMPDEDKRPFVDEAERLKTLHHLEFPEYKYRPKKRGRASSKDRLDLPCSSRFSVGHHDDDGGGGGGGGRLASTAEQNNEAALERLLSVELKGAETAAAAAAAAAAETVSSCSGDVDESSCRLLELSTSSSSSSPPQLGRNVWSDDVQGRISSSPSEATGVATVPADGDRCPELHPEDILRLLSTPTTLVGSPAEQLSHYTSLANSKYLHMRREDVDDNNNNNNNNNSLLLAGLHQENTVCGNISHIESFEDVLCVAETAGGSSHLCGDSQTPNVVEDFLSVFSCGYESSGLCPTQESMTAFSEMSDDLFELNQDMLREFAELADAVKDESLLLTRCFQ